MRLNTRWFCGGGAGQRHAGDRTVKLTSDQIYEAALDDQLFAELPSIVAESLGARSCVLHWRHQNGASEISTHSGYFSDGQMADYAANFASHDIWTEAGMRQQFVNRAWNTTDIVPASDYERSIFYNEWIRGMGDDTFFCCGSVMQTVHGHGIIGLHRGKTQGDFSKQGLRQLNRQVNHLRRMFAIRGRLAATAERRDLLNDIFEAGQQPAFMLGASGQLVMANAAGEAFLRGGRFLRLRRDYFSPTLDEDSQAFGHALAAASGRSERQASDCLLRARDGGVAIASFVPLGSASPKGAVLLTVDEPRARLPREVLGRHLQGRFGLSSAEADIALRLADGETIRAISDARRSAIATVRTQVKHVLLKMDARRQADVVRIVTTCLP
jgi:DNA-binding CsgD family transcriptional regulator